MVGGGGARNMKYKAPRMVAIFFMTILTGTGGGGGGMAPFRPGSAAGDSNKFVNLFKFQYY